MQNSLSLPQLEPTKYRVFHHQMLAFACGRDREYHIAPIGWLLIIIIRRKNMKLTVTIREWHTTIHC